MNIAIVDDEKIELETAEAFLRFYVKKFWSEHNTKIHIEVFYRAEDFFKIFCAGWFQAVILGAGMKDVANFIRARGDYDAKIIFLKLNDDSEGKNYEHCYC